MRGKGSMFAEQRKSAIINRVNTNTSVSLSELLADFHVSETTIRRDLSQLENAGELIRTHGGAIQNEAAAFLQSAPKEQDEHFKEKKSIANIVAGMVKRGDTVLLDSGTTTAQIARALRAMPITLVTNSAAISSEFAASKAEMEIHSTGGLFRWQTNSFVGSAAESYLLQIRPDIAFISAEGISISSGATTSHLLEAGIKKTMVSVARRVFLVADHSKFGKELFCVIARADAFEGIITDRGISRKTAAQFTGAGIPIIMESAKDDIE